MAGSCSICLGSSSDENVDKSPFASIPCGHVFHFACISQWLKPKVPGLECPECRAPCSRKKIIRLYLKNASPTKSNDSAVIAQLQKRVKRKSLDLKLVQVELKIEKHKATSAMKKLQQEHDALQIECDHLHGKLLEKKAANRQLRSDCETWKEKGQKYNVRVTRYKTRADALETEVATLKAKVSRWKNQTKILEREMGDVV